MVGNRGIRALIMIAISALVMSLAAVAPSQAAPDRRAPGGDTTIAPPTTNMCAAGDACYQHVQWRIDSFRAGNLRNSGGWRLPQNIRNKAAASMRVAMRTGRLPDGSRLPMNMRKDGEWWRSILSGTACFSYTSARFCGSGSIPDQDARELERVTESTAQVSIVCGGAALIGYSRSGGWWGVGQGVAACMWSTWMSRQFGW